MKKFISLLLCALLTGVTACGSDSNSGTQTQASAQTQAPAKAAPSPRYSAVSDTEMTWQDAGDWCAARGGKLPLINGASSLPSPLPTPSVSIDGVGTIDATGSGSYYPSVTPWANTGPLPTGYYYWTGTADTDLPGFSWYFDNLGGDVGVDSSDQSYGGRVVCVP